MKHILKNPRPGQAPVLFSFAQPSAEPHSICAVGPDGEAIELASFRAERQAWVELAPLDGAWVVVRWGGPVIIERRGAPVLEREVA